MHVCVPGRAGHTHPCPPNSARGLCPASTPYLSTGIVLRQGAWKRHRCSNTLRERKDRNTRRARFLEFLKESRKTCSAAAGLRVGCCFSIHPMEVSDLLSHAWPSSHAHAPPLMALLSCAWPSSPFLMRMALHTHRTGRMQAELRHPSRAATVASTNSTLVRSSPPRGLPWPVYSSAAPDSHVPRHGVVMRTDYAPLPPRLRASNEQTNAQPGKTMMNSFLFQR